MISRRSIFGFALVRIAPARAIQQSKSFLALGQRSADPCLLETFELNFPIQYADYMLNMYAKGELSMSYDTLQRLRNLSTNHRL